jgi:competence protein ComEA
MRNYTLHEYFFYTRLERNACNVLVILCIFGFALPSFFPFFVKNQDKYDFDEIRQMASAISQPGIAQANPTQARFREAKPIPNDIELFAFDPNTASKEDFVRLGLSPRTAQTILNYRTKGGKFFKKEDLKKIYGFRQEDYAMLAPWIQIQGNDSPWKDFSKSPDDQTLAKATGDKFETRTPGFSPKEKTAAVIDINLATAEEWQQLKGIGPGFSKRIVNFREKLGGFASIEQVGQTNGLPDSTFRQILPQLQFSPVFRKINVNTATLEELGNHPYLSNFQAKVIFNYRQQHGPFGNFDALKKVKAGFKEEDWTRLEAYLVFE